VAPSEPPTAPVADRSHAFMGALPFTASDDAKPANPKPRIADKKGCSPPYAVDARGKKLWKVECL
jgi:hypothetical protein